MAERMSLEDAVKRMNEIAEVTRPTAFASSPHRISILGAREWDSGTEREEDHRTSEVVRPASHSPKCIPT